VQRVWHSDHEPLELGFLRGVYGVCSLLLDR